jgi:hypothetical protein
MDHQNPACPICAVIGDYVEIENAQDPSDTDVPQRFPRQTEQLHVPNEPLTSYYQYSNERLEKCPHCGTYFWYREWAPGGSEDVLRTYIHESLRRLTFLEAHVELDDALYQDYQRAQERGGSYVAEYERTREGVQEEMAHLQVRYREVVWDVIRSLAHKHQHSEQLARDMERFYPNLPRSYVEEDRQRENRVAAYHATILAAYLAHWDPNDVPVELVHHLVRLLVDDQSEVRITVKDALLRLVSQAASAGRLVREVAAAAAQLSPHNAEVDELLLACRGTGRPNG